MLPGRNIQRYNFSMPPAIFLDRDGVIIANRPDYVRSWADVEIYPQALKALAKIKNSPYHIIIVTNQSVINRGLAHSQVIKEINERLLQEVMAAGGRIDAVFTCPHAPSDNCNCRKPRPGLLLEAAKKLCIDLPDSIMIGDALSDLAAGKAAGIQDLRLVLTGRGETQRSLPEAADLEPFGVYCDLLEALSDLI